MKAAIVIPARYASTRLPGKMLLEAEGKPLIRHVYERALLAKAAAEVVVATDDRRIFDAVAAFGGRAVMTDPAHVSGSSRVAEAARALSADVIVNLQGDEPEIDPSHLDRLIALQGQYAPFASTLACPFPAAADPADPSAVKAVLGKAIAPDIHEALYFTRAPAPFPRDGAAAFHLHVGVYAFRPDSLGAFAAAPESRLERIERLEQLRILEMGERILVGLVGEACGGIDTQADLDAFRSRLAARRR